MSRQYLRNYQLVIIGKDGAAREIKDLRVVFDVDKFIYSRANTCKIEIYNPSQDTIVLLETKFTKVYLSVGYGDNLNLSQLFYGQVRNVFNRRLGTETISTVYAADGEVALVNSFFNKSYEPEVTIDTVIKDVVKSFTSLLPGVIKGLPTIADKTLGQSLSGPSAKIMDDYADEYGFSWSIQDGEIDIIPDDDAITDNDAILVTSATGMVGSPTITELGVDVTTLLNPDFKPNRVFRVESVGQNVQVGDLFYGVPRATRAEGVYKVREVKFIGDSREGQWLSMVKGNTYV